MPLIIDPSGIEAFINKIRGNSNKSNTKIEKSSLLSRNSAFSRSTKRIKIIFQARIY